MIVQCCVCKKIRTPEGAWIEPSEDEIQAVKDGQASHGYCPVCLKQTLDDQVFPNYVGQLANIARDSLFSARHEIDRVDLSKLPVTSELTGKGFLFRFQREGDEIILSLEESHGVIFVHFRVGYCNYSGMVFQSRQQDARQLYNNIVDQLLAL